MGETMTPFDITGVKSENVRLIWDRVEPLIQRVIAHTAGEYEAEDILHALVQSQMQLWIAATETELKGCVVTEIRHFPRKKVCYVVMAAGDEIERWDHILPEIEHWAYERGVDLCQGFARLGWKPRAKAHGYELNYAVYTKELRAPNANSH